MIPFFTLIFGVDNFKVRGNAENLFDHSKIFATFASMRKMHANFCAIILTALMIHDLAQHLLIINAFACSLMLDFNIIAQFLGFVI